MVTSPRDLRPRPPLPWGHPPDSRRATLGVSPASLCFTALLLPQGRTAGQGAACAGVCGRVRRNVRPGGELMWRQWPWRSRGELPPLSRGADSASLSSRWHTWQWRDAWRWRAAAAKCARRSARVSSRLWGTGVVAIATHLLPQEYRRPVQPSREVTTERRPAPGGDGPSLYCGPDGI